MFIYLSISIALPSRKILDLLIIVGTRISSLPYPNSVNPQSTSVQPINRSRTHSMEQRSILTIPVVWRGKKLMVEINSGASLKEFGDELQKLTDIRADTMKLIVPQSSSKTSGLLWPFSHEHSYLKLQDTSIPEVRSLRMMGVSEGEFNQILQSANVDLRLISFEEEDKRMKQRMSYVPWTSHKLPQGSYIFCGFHTLELLGIQLNPPPSEALKIMHRLAADPGIVAIMNKHRWRVGIMTELAPVGYVGVSPKCILGLNKNHGEEISLCLRTDDLKGFRKYESIKKTLLHELAHMVYPEHDASFYALDKQLNQDAAFLDWTKSRSHTLTGVSSSEHYDVDSEFESKSNLPHTLGGSTSLVSATAHAASVAAANHRLADTLARRSAQEEEKEPDPDDSELEIHGKANSTGTADKIENLGEAELRHNHKPNPDVCTPVQTELEPDPDDSVSDESMESEPCYGFGAVTKVETDPDDTEMRETVKTVTRNDRLDGKAGNEEPDLDDGTESRLKYAVESSYVGSHSFKTENIETMRGTTNETDPNNLAANMNCLPIHDDCSVTNGVGYRNKCEAELKIEFDDSYKREDVKAKPDLDDQLAHPVAIHYVKTDEPDPDDQELRRIQDPVTMFCNQLTKTIEMLCCEVNPTEGPMVLQTLFKIIRNLLEHSNEIKYSRLRKGNPMFQRSIAKYNAAMEILSLVGFNEDTMLDESGRAETYLVLKRDDPGLLWLAKSSLETSIAR